MSRYLSLPGLVVPIIGRRIEIFKPFEEVCSILDIERSKADTSSEELSEFLRRIVLAYFLLPFFQFVLERKNRLVEVEP